MRDQVSSNYSSPKSFAYVDVLKLDGDRVKDYKIYIDLTRLDRLRRKFLISRDLVSPLQNLLVDLQFRS